MYGYDSQSLNGLVYNLVRFIIPLYLSEISIVPFVKRREYFIPHLLSSSLVYFAISILFTYYNIGINIAWFSTVYATIFLFSLIPLIASLDLSIKKILFFAMAGYTVQNLADNFASLIIKSLNLEFSNYLFSIILYTCYIFILLIYMFCFLKRVENSHLETMDNKILVFSLVLSLLVIYVLSMYGQQVDSTIGYISIKCYAIVSSLFILITQFNNFHVSLLEDENAILEKLLNKENESFANSKRTMDLVNMKCHDLKHQINSLRQYVTSKEEEESLNELEKQVEIYDNTIKSGNTTIDSIVAEKSLYCKQHKIRFSSMIDGEKLNFMSNIDIYALFGNALDNAIEAVEKLEEDKRTITMNVKKVNNLIAIHIENYTRDNVEFENNLPKTKKDRSFHGYGTKSIEYVSRKYKGKAYFKVVDNKFILNVMIPFQSK